MKWRGPRLGCGAGLVPPGGVNAGALDLDFAQRRYGLGGVAQAPGAFEAACFSRASTAWMADAAGVLQPFASGVLRRTDGVGALIEVARQNKCTNWNANPTDLTRLSKGGDAAATLAVVDDEAALEAAGLAAICAAGTVCRLDNSAGSSTAHADASGTTGNTNAHSASVYVRGSGVYRAGMAGALSIGTATSSYQRFLNANRTPPNGGQFFRIQADPGAVLYFILNQLEEGVTVTSPIVTPGASATRAADALYVPLTAGGHDVTCTFDDESTQLFAAETAVFAPGSAVLARPLLTLIRAVPA